MYQQFMKGHLIQSVNFQFWSNGPMFQQFIKSNSKNSVDTLVRTGKDNSQKTIVCQVLVFFEEHMDRFHIHLAATNS